MVGIGPIEMNPYDDLREESCEPRHDTLEHSTLSTEMELNEDAPFQAIRANVDEAAARFRTVAVSLRSEFADVSFARLNSTEQREKHIRNVLSMRRVTPTELEKSIDDHVLAGMLADRTHGAVKPDSDLGELDDALRRGSPFQKSLIGNRQGHATLIPGKCQSLPQTPANGDLHLIPPKLRPMGTWQCTPTPISQAKP